MHAFFSGCDCIFIETTPGSGHIPQEVWQFASERTISSTIGMESLRYFIVGNRKDGYEGIERNLEAGIEIHHNGRATWKYTKLQKEDCERVLTERKNSLGND